MKKTFTLLVLASLATLQLAYTSTSTAEKNKTDKKVTKIERTKTELNIQKRLLSEEVTSEGDDVINASNDRKLLQGNRN